MLAFMLPSVTWRSDGASSLLRCIWLCPQEVAHMHHLLHDISTVLSFPVLITVTSALGDSFLPPFGTSLAPRDHIWQDLLA